MSGVLGTPYEAMKFMVDIERADVPIASGYSNSNVLTAETLHDLRFDTDVFIYGEVVNSKEVAKWASCVDPTIQEIMPRFVQCRARLSRIDALLLNSVSESELAFFPVDSIAGGSCFMQMLTQQYQPKEGQGITDN